MNGTTDPAAPTMAQRVAEWGPLAVLGFTSIVFLAALVLAYRTASPTTLFTTLTSTAGAAWLGGVGYYTNSSKGSADKSKTIERQSDLLAISSPPPPPIPTQILPHA